MNDTILEFVLDNNGVCNFCNDFKKKCNQTLSKIEVDKNLQIIKKKIKKNKKNSKYDCIIGLSGGVDSSFCVYLAWKMNLNPLIIHMDNGWNSKVSNQNINKILEKTNFDYKTLVLDWSEFKDLQLSFLKSGVPDIELVTDHAIFAYILNYSILNKIKFIITGVNFATEHCSIPSWGWRKDDFYHINKIHKKFGKINLKTFPKMHLFKKFYYEKILKKVQYINLLDYINYKILDAKKILKNEFEWEDYGSKHNESFFTKFFQGYILPKKFGIDKRLLHYSCLIRNKEINRDEAKNMISLPFINTQKIKEYKNFFIKKLSLSEKNFYEIMNSKPRKHSDYSYDYRNNFFIKSIRKIIK